MSSNTVHLTLRSPFRVLLDESVDSIHLKTDTGEMEVFPLHAELVGMIRFSRVMVRMGSTLKEFFLRQGSISVEQDGTVNVIGLDVQETGAMQVDSVSGFLTVVNERLERGEELNAYQRTFLEEQRSALQEAIEHMRAK